MCLIAVDAFITRVEGGNGRCQLPTKHFVNSISAKLHTTRNHVSVMSTIHQADHVVPRTQRAILLFVWRFQLRDIIT